jgi:hypothetical protein
MNRRAGRVMQARLMHKSVHIAAQRALIQIAELACWLVQRVAPIYRFLLHISSPRTAFNCSLLAAAAGAPIKLLELSLCAIIFAFGALRNRLAHRRGRRARSPRKAPRAGDDPNANRAPQPAQDWPSGGLRARTSRCN